MPTIEGSRERLTAGYSQGSLGPFTNAGAPTAATQAGVAAKGALLIDTANANLYINDGTLATPDWKLFTRAA